MVKISLFIFLLFGQFLGQKSLSQVIEIKVISYNIYHGENPYYEGTTTLNQLAQLIKNYQPDIVFLQEVDIMTLRSQSIYGKKIDFMDFLGKLTKMYSHFAKAIDFAEGGYGEGVLTKYPANFRTLKLPNPKGGEERSLAIASVNYKDSIKLNFAGTHLCHEFVENRTEQVEAIVDMLYNNSEPFIVGGDFNFTSDEIGYSKMISKFLDVAHQVGKEIPTYATDNPAVRIDYIWIDNKSNWKIIDYEVLDASFSDHFPIMVTLRYTK